MSVCVGESSVSCRVFSTKNSESKNHGNLMGVNHAEGYWPLIRESPIGDVLPRCHQKDITG